MIKIKFFKKFKFLSLFFLVYFLGMLLLSVPAWSQEYDDDPLFSDDDGGYESFTEEFGDSGFGIPNDFLDPGLLEEEGVYDPFGDPEDEEDLYLDQDEFGVDTEQAIKESLLDQGVLMDREKKQGLSNILYGAGTGMMIGAWTAFITSENTTRTQWRTIGTSTVLGGAIGLMLGTRSIWDPNAVRPLAKMDLDLKWMVQNKPSGFKISYYWNF